MVWILGLGFGSLILFFLIRRLTRGITSLEDYRQQFEEKRQKTEHEIQKELLTLPPSETLAPVAAGIREMLALHGTGIPCRVEVDGTPPRITIQLPGRKLEVQYRLRPAGHVRTGCYWELKAPETTMACRSLDEVMRRIEQILEAAGCMRRPLI